MRLNNLPQEFIDAKPVLDTIKEAGFEAYFVGGSVRDTLLGLKIHDVDIATSAYPEEIKHIFKKTVDTGIEHGTVMILDHGQGYETTTFRTESGYQDYRRPDKVTFVRSLKDDLKRRDLTINALALAADGEVIDLFDGLKDLQERRIKAVGNPNERFHEDALRMMRAIRFASQLNFEIEDATLAAIVQNAPLLAKIAVERINVEFVKLMLGKDVKKGLEPFITSGLYQYCPQFLKHQQDLKDLLKLNQITCENEEMCWTLLLFALHITKPAAFLKVWKVSNEMIRHVEKALTCVNDLKQEQLDALSMYHAGEKALKLALAVAKLYQPSLDKAHILADYQALPIKNKDELRLNGKILLQETNLKPGPQLGKILNEVERQVVIGQIKNEKTKLLQLAQQLNATK